MINTRALIAASTLAATAGALHAQVESRRAVLRGSGNSDHGKCTIEVVVDGAADVEVRGENAVIRTLSGRPAQFRRFECSAIMPPNPRDFRFSGVDGRGRQTLIRDPRNGGAAVVRIEDAKGGAEGYTFDLTWSGADPFGRGGWENRGGYPDRDDFHNDRDAWFRQSNFEQRFFDRIRQDVEHVRASAFSGGDEHRLSKTIHELDELQNKLARGRYDQGELDDVIEALDRVVRDNRLTRRDRDLLADDLDRLRDFRARHDRYGAR